MGQSLLVRLRVEHFCPRAAPRPALWRPSAAQIRASRARFSPLAVLVLPPRSHSPPASASAAAARRSILLSSNGQQGEGQFPHRDARRSPCPTALSKLVADPSLHPPPFLSLVSQRTKKAGITGKYGVRYGASLRKQVKKMEISQHSKYTCVFCGKDTVKRTVVGIWSCGACKKTVAGGAYTLNTAQAAQVRAAPPSRSARRRYHSRGRALPRLVRAAEATLCSPPRPSWLRAALDPPPCHGSFAHPALPPRPLQVRSTIRRLREGTDL